MCRRTNLRAGVYSTLIQRSFEAFCQRRRVHASRGARPREHRRPRIKIRVTSSRRSVKRDL